MGAGAHVVCQKVRLETTGGSRTGSELFRHARFRRAAIRFHDELHLTAGGGFAASQLNQRPEQMLKRRGLRAFGSEPLCAAMKTPLRSLALQTGDWQLDGGMTVGTDYFDS